MVEGRTWKSMVHQSQRRKLMLKLKKSCCRFSKYLPQLSPNILLLLYTDSEENLKLLKKSCPSIVRFISRISRNKIYSSRKKLKSAEFKDPNTEFLSMTTLQVAKNTCFFYPINTEKTHIGKVTAKHKTNVFNIAENWHTNQKNCCFLKISNTN